jgi:hypothetical protein
MPIVPYIQDLEAYKHHFQNLEPGRKLHPVKSLKVVEETQKPVVLKIVSPTQQAVERAEALVKKEKKQKKKKPWNGI